MNQEPSSRRILSSFRSEKGEILGNLFDLPLDVTVDKLQIICNTLLQQDPTTPYLFFVNDQEIRGTLNDVIEKNSIRTEEAVEIIYQQQAVFTVRPITRCTSSIPGHSEAIVSNQFSPNGQYLASGSGDTTVRFWDLNSQTPEFTCKGHKNWVLCISFSPDGSRLASGCKNGVIILWDPKTGKQIGKNCNRHTKFITAICWEPYHRNSTCRRFASSSKDGNIIIWDSILCQSLLFLTSHTMNVTCLRWGGNGLIYSGSQDRTIKVWRDSDGALCRTLQGHAHWVNAISLNTDYVLRTGPYSPPNFTKATQQEALERYNKFCAGQPEKLVSCSDDFTLFLWNPEKQTQSINRLTGHSNVINDVKYSPDGRLIASASFDKSIRIWDGNTGKYIITLLGHVNRVYLVSWSADSRLLVSGSRDSTLKVWSMKTKKLQIELPGHADEVFALDWSPDSRFVASGGKDKILKLWQH